MTFKKDLCYGRIISIPALYGEMHAVVALPPDETVPEKGWIMMCPIEFGVKRHEWEVQYGHLVINCYIRHKMEPKKFSSCKIEEILDDDMLRQLEEAYEFRDTRWADN